MLNINIAPYPESDELDLQQGNFFFGCNDILMQKIRGNESSEEVVSSHLSQHLHYLEESGACQLATCVSFDCKTESHYIML